MQLTRTSEKLKRTILFNAERTDVPFFAPPQTGYFSLILIRRAVGYITVNTKNGAHVSFPIQRPMAICLRDNESATFSVTDCDVYNVVFSPTFINVNMQPSVLEEEVYAVLAEAHHLFRLAPFMEVRAELKCITMNEEQMNTYFRKCDSAVSAMEEEDPDKRWSCRIRSFFMDILTGLEAQYAYMLQAAWDTSLTFMTYRDIVIHIHGDLMNPCRIEEVCRRFGVNKNKLQHIFYLYSGSTYHSFIKKARVERAKSYLAFTGLSLSEIAFRLGFSTEQHFYRFFRREAGVAPLVFRQAAVADRKAAFAELRVPGREDPGCYPMTWL